MILASVSEASSSLEGDCEEEDEWGGLLCFSLIAEVVEADAEVISKAGQCLRGKDADV